MKQVNGNVLDNLQALITKALNEYKECLKEDPDNTDSIMFILEDIANKNHMNEQEFEVYSAAVYKEID